MIEELAQRLLRKYPPEPLIESRGWSTDVARGIWEKLRYASEVARRAGQEVDYQLCRHLSELFWGTENRNAELIVGALEGILYATDYVTDLHVEKTPEEHKSLCALSYFLLALERKRVLSGDRCIYYWQEAQELLQGSLHYQALLTPLIKLQGKTLGDSAIASVRDEIRAMKIPRFEQKIIDILLAELKRPEQ